MPSTFYRWSLPIIAAVCMQLIYLIATHRELPHWLVLDGKWMQVVHTFFSIFLDALPFMLLGITMSTIVENFIPESFIRKMTPRHPLGGILFACLLGILFPLCECGMIPFVRRLMRKGMPVYIAVILILVGPVLNPVSFAATYMAFDTEPLMAYARMGLTFLVALVVGLLMTRFVTYNPVRNTLRMNAADPCEEGCSHPGHDHSHTSGRPMIMLSHAYSELLEMSKYLMFGALVTAFIQTFIPKASLASFGQDSLVSHMFMIVFAYLLSLCSTTDAFVAASFSDTFSLGALLGFLVFGPMIDIKSTFMLLSVFKARFVLQLAMIVTIVVLAGSHLFEMILWP
ncbi:permease [Paenibacillus hexagrammi]|uniref:Permease n=1 Tax=Paenibacillus hexagrammi TaxID=2908839 RepID=A0ABY3SEA2_9BACL|nr:permease [Paenibacillus sp. YPD9-1]UJF32317.1 permease [Paenibacillus sp. YPD9-1]